MTTPATPSGSKPSGDDRNLVVVDETNATSFEDRAQMFWQRNRALVLGMMVVVVLIIVGKAGWEYMQRQKELEIEKAYATAGSSPEQLKSFVAANRDHPLAAAAELTLADKAYADGKVADAIAGYDRVIAILKTGPLAARAQLGRAVAKAQSGKASEATTELKQLADDANQLKAVRAEAAYHLASLSVEAGNPAEATKFLDQISRIEQDPRANPWAMRAMALRMTLPVTASAEPVAPAPVAAPGAAPAANDAKKADAPDSKVQIKLPGK